MKKLFLLIAFAGILSVSAQEHRLHCYSTEEYKQDIQNDPQYAKNQADLEAYTQQFIKNAPVQRSNTGPVYIIPVVFHILHEYGDENISDAQCIDAVRIMTRDYRKLNADTDQIYHTFVSIAADIEVEFRLATIDPNGNCTNGIEHIQTTKTFLADDASKLNPWPCNKYMNIWVAHSLANAGAAAYAHLPGGANATDGIMSRYDYVGSIGASSETNSRTLTHEMGHCFNLLHVWGNTNSPGITCGDDGVSDTPISIGWDHCDTLGSYCNPPIVENVQNYMEYSYCDVMFTQGQKSRMRSALTSTWNGRNNLWTQSNLIATGTTGPPITICVPIADFKANYINVCVGNPVTFMDQSWKAPITSWRWDFPGGNPSSSVDSSPVVTYAAAGIYDATLIVTGSAGGDTILRTSYIRVTDTALRTMPFVEDFESAPPASFPGVDGWIENPDNSNVGLWTRVTNANTTTGGTAAIKINNFSNTAGQVDSWITPSIDFTNVGFPVRLYFMLSNAQRNASSDDSLIVLYSYDCGKSWLKSQYAKSGAGLATAGISSTSFSPTNASQWRQESVNINPVQGKPNVRFKFQNTSNRGNNTYIDDINITGTFAGIKEQDEFAYGIAMFPNPSNGNTDLNFDLIKTCKVTVEVKDILGKSISTVIDKNLPQGTYNQKLPVLSAGIYIVDVIINNKHHVKKLIVS